MSLPKKSLKILQDLLSKDLDSLTSIEVDLAKNQLLALYELLMLVNLNNEDGKNLSKKSNSISNKVQEGQSLFDELYANHEMNEKEESGVVLKEMPAINNNEEDGLTIGKEVELETEMDAFSLESQEEENGEEGLSLDQANVAQEHAKVFDITLEDSIDEDEAGEQESSNKGEGSVLLSDQIQMAFEPPLSQDDFLEMWTPSDSEVILQEPTKSGFSDVKDDLNLEKKIFSRGDIRTLIGINDRYLYSNELFNNKEEYEEALNHLNAFENITEAKAYLNQFFTFKNLDLDQQAVKDDVAESFMKMLESYYRF